MTFSLTSPPTEFASQHRLPVVEFEPLLDANEAAALLRMHPKTLKKKACLGLIPLRRLDKSWRFRASELND